MKVRLLWGHGRLYHVAMWKRLTLLLTLACFGAVIWAQDSIKKIQALDKIKVTCSEESLLSKSYKVTKDGVILVDFLGAVEVQGLTEKEAAEKLSQKLVSDRILKTATVTVVVLPTTTTTPAETKPTVPQPGETKPAETKPEASKPSDSKPVEKTNSETKPIEQGVPQTLPSTSPIKFSGEVAAPGEMAFREGLKLSDVVKSAGTTENADLSHVTLKSTDGAARVLDANNPAEDLVLKPGDEIIVPTLKKESPVRNEIYVMGGVAKPGAILLSGPMTVRSAIEAAGGFSSVATKKKVTVERPGQPVQELDMTVDNADLAVLPNDKIVVEVSESRAYVSVDGAVRNPGYFVVRPGMKLSEAIESAGGVLPKAKTEHIKIIPADGGKPKDINYNEIVQGFCGDVVLQAGDQVSIPGEKKRNSTPIKVAAGVAAFWFLFGR